jgi:hypothetical protein
MKKIARVVKQADFISKFTEKAKELGLKLGFNSDVDYSWGKDTVHTIMYEKGGTTYLVVQVIITVDEYNYIRIYDTKNNLLGEYKIRGDNFDFNVFVPILNFITDKLNEKEEELKPQQQESVSHETKLETAEQVYDFGEENNWQGLEDKHYKILSKDKNLAQMAVADMQDKELQVPEILKKFRRYSMSFKDVLISKIASEKKAEKVENKVEKKAAEEDIDVKLKVQKNKPAGLDTSSPKSLPESIRPLIQDLKGKISDVEEIEAQLAARKAELDAKYQEAKNESKVVEKKAEIENLTNNIGKLLFAAKNETFQFQDNLVALTHQTKVVPAKATDKWKFEKVFEKLKSLMGNENAQKFLDATLNGLQSQATEKTITELNIFSPTQKQLKTSDTSDTNKFIDALKEIYMNLRSYFLDVKKANNIIEEQLATGATASKKQNVLKKAEYKAEEDVLFEMMEDFEIFTPGEIEVGITVGGRNLETAEAMLFSRTGLRNLTQLKDDLRNGGTDQETLDSYMVGDIEDTEIESKKKINLKKAKTNKKAKVSKKASVQLNLEIDDYIELLKDRYESAPADWKARGGRLLIDELYEYMENYDGGKVEIPSIVIDNFLINGDIVEKSEFTADGEASNKFEKYNGNWDEFCEEEAVIYNDNAACTNLGF